MRRFSQVGLLIIAACGLLMGCQQAVPPTPSPRVGGNGIINWVRDPNVIIFRADIVGGATPDFVQLSETPQCTIYGDNRVVWVNEVSAPAFEVLIDVVGDEAITRFIEYLTIQERVFSYASATQPPESSADPVLEQVIIDVSGQRYVVDNTSGWDADWFNRVLNLCKRISSTPILYEPSGGWLTVRRVDDVPAAPKIYWQPGQNGLTLSILNEGERYWQTGAAALSVWRLLYSLPYTAQIVEGDAVYQMALQVPGITRDAPAAPPALSTPAAASS